MGQGDLTSFLHISLQPCTATPRQEKLTASDSYSAVIQPSKSNLRKTFRFGCLIDTSSYQLGHNNDNNFKVYVLPYKPNSTEDVL